MANYYVVTDTHGFPWGNNYSQAIDFDLGDNTPSTDASFVEDIHDTGATLTLIGNHDTVCLDPDDVTAYMDTILEYRADSKAEKGNEKVAFFGINVTREMYEFDITDNALSSLASKMEDLPSNVNVVILSHVPLFKSTTAMGDSYPNENDWVNWSKVETLISMLQAFNNQSSNYTLLNKSYNFNNGGRVIGCFSGHIHNHVKCYYKNIYMESFGTNGASEWTSSGSKSNSALYQPTIKVISIDLQNKKVNGQDYIHTGTSTSTQVISIENGYSGTAFGDAAIGPYALGDNYYPKFYQGAYVGYSYDDATQGIEKINNNDGYFSLGNGVNIPEINKTAKYIRFDAAGLLRYYSTTTKTNSAFIEIPNYKTATITFTYNNVNWSFKNGLLVYAAKFVSGTIYGKNNFSIVFDSNGYAKQINENGVKKDYPAGDNWINIYNLRVFWRPFTDHSNYDSTGNVPQIGITGTFGTNTRIDLARSTTSGSNWIPNRYNVLIRVVGENNVVSWLYDGRLTNLTDSELGI